MLPLPGDLVTNGQQDASRRRACLSSGNAVPLSTGQTGQFCTEHNAVYTRDKYLVGSRGRVA
jgi:hypothetical protein